VSRPPVFSRDGRLVAVFEVDPLSQRERLVIRSVPESKLVSEIDDLGFANVDWSPDGTGLIYTRSIDGAQGMWHHPIHGEQPRRILDLGTEPSIYARLSQDGRRLAYIAARPFHQQILIDGLS